MISLKECNGFLRRIEVVVGERERYGGCQTVEVTGFVTYWWFRERNREAAEGERGRKDDQRGKERTKRSEDGAYP